MLNGKRRSSKLLCRNQSFPLPFYAKKVCFCPLIVRVLGNQLAPKSKSQHRLSNLAHLVGLVEEGGPGGLDAGPGGSEVLGAFGGGEGFQGCFGFMHQLADGENAGLVQWERKALFLMSVSAMICASVFCVAWPSALSMNSWWWQLSASHLYNSDCPPHTRVCGECSTPSQDPLPISDFRVYN